MWWAIIGTALFALSAGFVWGVAFTLTDNKLRGDQS